jgi:3-oxoacyl-[acyl-carrier-protein] synthase II
LIFLKAGETYVSSVFVYLVEAAMSDRKIVVTGLGVVSPVGNGAGPFWDALLAGKSGIGPITAFDASEYRTTFAGQADFDESEYLDKKEARKIDRFGHLAIGASDMAVKDAGLDLSTIDPDRAGVLIGSGIGGLRTLELQYETLLEKGPSRVSPFTIPMMICNIVAGLVAIRHGLKGPNYSVVSACATAAHSIGDAMRMIERGDADIMLAGGSEAAITPMGIGGFCALKALSTRNDDPTSASRPFDADRDGFVMGEGAAVLVLESLEHAQKRGAEIYCEAAGFGLTCDAHHMTAPLEDGSGAAKAMQMAMKDAGVSPDQVSYINAHGTSTPLNDKGETGAIKLALGEDNARKVMISSTKSMTGHLLGAAGGIESAVTALAIKHGVVPPTINYTTPDPACDLDYVPNEARETEVKVTLNNSLGFGGHNACLLFKSLG